MDESEISHTEVPQGAARPGIYHSIVWMCVCNCVLWSECEQNQVKYINLHCQKCCLLDTKDYTDNPIKILQTAALGEHVTLPCRVENKQGNLQWTRSTSSQLKSIIDNITFHCNLSYASYQEQNDNNFKFLRDDFGLGRNRDLKGSERHHMSSFSPITSSPRLSSSLLCINASEHHYHHH